MTEPDSIEPNPVPGPGPSDGAWSMEQVLAAESSGAELDFILFWGHTPLSDGQVGAHVLSQWFERRFQVDGVDYPSAEHFMMAEKARLFGDEAARDEILASATPAEAKALGRKVRGFDGTTWSANRTDVVIRASLGKFGGNDDLGRYLIGTGQSILVEASPQDRIWGIGLGRDHPSARVPSQWEGLNLLGFALMQARARLAEAG